MRILIITLLLFGALCQAPVSAGNITQLQSVKQLRMKGIQRQTLDYSCGAAALSILLKDYFGDTHEEQDLLTDIVVRLSKEEIVDRMQEGFSMLDLKRTAERIGYSAEGIMLPPEAVTALEGPVIILLRRRELNHFVVLKGVAEGRAFLADPARGHLRVPLYELFQEWHGEALIVGREEFGLPKNHALALPNSRALAPERETVRALQHTPLN